MGCAFNWAELCTSSQVRSCALIILKEEAFSPHGGRRLTCASFPEWWRVFLRTYEYFVKSEWCFLFVCFFNYTSLDSHLSAFPQGSHFTLSLAKQKTQTVKPHLQFHQTNFHLHVKPVRPNQCQQTVSGRWIPEPGEQASRESLVSPKELSVIMIWAHTTNRWYTNKTSSWSLSCMKYNFSGWREGRKERSLFIWMISNLIPVLFF